MWTNLISYKYMYQVFMEKKLKSNIMFQTWSFMKPHIKNIKCFLQQTKSFDFIIANDLDKSLASYFYFN